MLNAKEIKEVTFSKSMGGYKQDEVDTLLDKVEQDYELFEREKKSLEDQITALKKELTDKDVSMEQINTVLLSAQTLADSITTDAKMQAEDIVNNANIEAEQIKQRTKKALEEIDAVITAQKAQAQTDVERMLQDAARKSEGMILAAKDSVAREQILFDKLKLEVATFKKQIKELYKDHLESLSKLPEEVPLNAESAAAAVEDIINKEPDLLRFIERDDSIPVVTEPASEPAAEPENPASESPVEPEPVVDLDAIKSDLSSGFVVKSVVTDDPEEEDEDDGKDKSSFSKGFFVKRK